MTDSPLISCLCVTHHKPDMLKRAICCFHNQDYLNKQMVIVYEESDLKTHEFITLHKFEDNIKIVNIKADIKLTLGELRNISVRKADGSFVCQWDDDDWYNDDRLTEQMKWLSLSGKLGCVLSRWIVFDACSQIAYLSFKKRWEGSILCQRDLMLQTPYPPLPKDEDTEVIELLYKQGALSVIDDMPHLYVYIFHGNNTWDDEHFKEIIDHCHELSASYTKDIIEVLAASECL